ncbi:response regulator [Leptospira wolffii]|uniref:Response regulator n=1 Tax=Leptospira wolffii TaxID=409998 RepID=A0A2M9Z778_9LEPT|nr:response regulator transcription factor [Leptospira wolffii]PJZ64289.1 DNA-binding response regulator [Leptospira wolffii]TGK55916.1 DNA-binding response regulator [Leptospira wolffii]TGK71962.1 DNA-binding response regulator [Leptospira wolffii]TGK78616.1 DNA-binding response regulator [Leptospira wolffii]TGL27539.1 DNA-binding response regulator [Leptospira wolffii]
MIDTVLADDHVLIREGLKKILSVEEDIRIIHEAENGQEVLDFLESRSASILILDINMPSMGGLDVLKHIQRISPNTRVLVLSMYPEDRFAVRALKAGADGYITKGSAAEELIGAIRKVVSGQRYVSPDATEILVRELAKPTDRLPHELLSEREFQIMLMLAKGKSVRSIAEELTLSVNTVNTYRARIFDKMNLKTSQELVRYAFDQRLVE